MCTLNKNICILLRKKKKKIEHCAFSLKILCFMAMEYIFVVLSPPPPQKKTM